jgi:hypothetical protein
MNFIPLQNVMATEWCNFQYNEIELVWTKMKWYTAERNNTFKTAGFKMLSQEIIGSRDQYQYKKMYLTCQKPAGKGLFKKDHVG